MWGERGFRVGIRGKGLGGNKEKGSGWKKANGCGGGGYKENASG